MSNPQDDDNTTQEAKPSQSPAFQFYPKDFLTDIKVVLMPPAVRGMYVTLLCHDWLQDGLPEDAIWILCASGMTQEEWLKGSWPLLQGCFTKHPKKSNTLTSWLLIGARASQEKWRKKCSEGGKKSAATRKALALSVGYERKGSSKIVPTNDQLNGNSPSPSPSPIYTEGSKDPSVTPPKILPEKITLAPRISMTKESAQTLIEEFGRESCEYYKKVCSDYLVENGKTKKDCAAFMRRWIRREIAERKGFYYPKQNGFQPHTAASTAQKNLEYFRSQNNGTIDVEELFASPIERQKELGGDAFGGTGLVPFVDKSK